MKLEVFDICSECRSNPCLRRCPNYIAPSVRHHCSICGDGIDSGEEYIRNDDNEYAHWECFYGMKHLLDWLGYELEIIEE